MTDRKAYDRRSDPEDVPCFVVYGRNRLVWVEHPSGDYQHPNAVACRARLRQQGFRIAKLPVPAAMRRHFDGGDAA